MVVFFVSLRSRLRMTHNELNNKMGYIIDYKALGFGKHNLSFEVDKELFALYDYQEIKGGRCSVDIDMEYSECCKSEILLNVKINGTAVVECDRCLEECDIPINFEEDVVIKIYNDTLYPEHKSDDDAIWIAASEPKVELTQYIYESIILSLPYQRVHEEGRCNEEMTKYIIN